MLRSHCQRLKVVQKLSGAHLFIKLDQSIAVRAYFSCDLKEMIETEKGTSTKNDDFDELHSFLKTFKLAVVFFILPIEEQREQLDDPQSLYHRAQRLIRTVTHSGNNKIARSFLLSTPEKAIAIISSFDNACNNRMVEKKTLYFEKQHQRYFLPRPNHIPTTSIPAGASHIRAALSDWANRFEFPSGEADVMANMLGTLQAIGTADASVLQTVPLDSRSKNCMMQFFGSTDQEDIAEQKDVSNRTHVDASPPPNIFSEPPTSRRPALSHVSPMMTPMHYNDSPGMPMISSEIQQMNKQPILQEAQYHPYHMASSGPIQESPISYHQSFNVGGPTNQLYDQRSQFLGNLQAQQRFMPLPKFGHRYKAASARSRGPSPHQAGRGLPPPMGRNVPAPFPPRARRFVNRMNPY